VVFSDQTDADVFGIAEDELAAAVSMFIVRGGRIRGVRGWVIDMELERSTGELVEYVMQNVYAPIDGAEQQEMPKEVIVPLLPEDSKETSSVVRRIFVVERLTCMLPAEAIRPGSPLPH
jgi:excinuclease ABC subunit C